MALNDPVLLSVEQVAEQLGLHVRTVRAYLRSGRLKGVRIGKQYRIAREDLAQLTGRGGPLEPVVRHRHVDVSSIVQVDAISPESVERVTNMLMAAAKAPRQEEHSLRVDTAYDDERARLKVFISGSPETTISLLQLINTMVVERKEA
jgi:excisionase family DNA binding protein